MPPLHKFPHLSFFLCVLGFVLFGWCHHVSSKTGFHFVQERFKRFQVQGTRWKPSEVSLMSGADFTVHCVGPEKKRFVMRGDLVALCVLCPFVPLKKKSPTYRLQCICSPGALQ